MLALIRGAGDIASGAAMRLWRCGIDVVMTDLARPTAIRRTVAFSDAIVHGETTVEGLRAVRAENAAEAKKLLREGSLPVLADPECACREELAPDALVDAILAKRNLGTKIDDAPIVVGVGPGFTAGEDCHAVVETMRGHTLDMLRLADFLSAQYADTVNRSLLLTGTLLHDFAKEQEFTFSELGLVTDYSTKGQLLGHLVMGAQEVAAIAAELDLPEEKATLLEHLILSHHGQPEFGAAVLPQCAEAELLSLVDQIDSRMEIYREVLAPLKAGEFSQRVFALDNRRVYKHK